jgi:DNA-binding NarL/FixJ family response regulator
VNARIIVADDHEVVREGVRKLLAKSRPEWVVVGEAGEGVDALKVIRDTQPDVAVLDITMPGLSGFEVANRVSKLGLNTRLLIFTAHDFDRLACEVSHVGAHGYVLKSEAARNLVLAIDTLLEGGTFYGSASALPPPARPRKAAKAKAGGSYRLRLGYSAS